MNPGNKSKDEQEYTVYGVSRIHKNTLSEAEKYPLNYTAIYDEMSTSTPSQQRRKRRLWLMRRLPPERVGGRDLALDISRPFVGIKS